MLMYFPWNILPITFVLWMHFRNYSQIKRVVKFQMGESDASASVS